MDKIAPYAKAVAGGLAGALTAAYPLLDDGVSLSDAAWIALAFLTGLGVVYVAPANRPKA